MAEIEDQRLESTLRQTAGDILEEPIGGAEEQVIIELEHEHTMPLAGEHGHFLG